MNLYRIAHMENVEAGSKIHFQEFLIYPHASSTLLSYLQIFTQDFKLYSRKLNFIEHNSDELYFANVTSSVLT